MAKPHLQLIILGVLILCALPQQIKPTLLLPVETTQNVTTSYSLGFSSDTSILHSARIRVTFPFEFDPRQLIFFEKCEIQQGQEEIK